MMSRMKTKMSILATVLAAFVAVGCSSSNAPQSLNTDYMKTAAETRKDVDAMYQKSGGDYDKLSPEEHERYLKYFAGKEGPAKEYWDKMKSGGVASSISEVKK
jgi:hypothetical protein